MKEELNSISEKHNLWKNAESNASKCIENYILESIELDFPMLKKVTKSDFTITKDSQCLIFWNKGSKTFVLRTNLNISLQNEIENISGYYSYDVNENGEFVDDLFVLK